MSRINIVIDAELYSEDYSFEKDGKTYEGTSYGLQFCEDKSFKYGFRGKHKISKETFDNLVCSLNRNTDGVPIMGADKFGNLIVKRIENNPVLKYDDNLLRVNK